MTARSTAAALIAVGALLLAGCGSQLDPSQVVSAQNGAESGQYLGTPGTGQQANGGGTIPDGGSLPDGTGAGNGAGSDGSGSGGTGDAPSGSDDTGNGSGGSNGSNGSNGSDGSNGSGGTAAADCNGFANQTGVTDSDITIANASDISGPVPGIFASTQQAVQAYAAYFNATSDICGRKLKVLALDTRTDAGGDQQAYAQACQQAFAAVGSMAAFDNGGAATAQQCGLPDIRSAIVNGARNSCSTCFAAQSGTPNTSANVVPQFLVHTYGQAARNAGYVYINAGPAVENATDEIKAWSRQGLRFTSVQSIGVAEFNYAPYVQQLKSKGVGLVRFLGAASQAVRLRQAMAQADYHPVFVEDSEAYDPAYVQQGGSAVDGTIIFVNFPPFTTTGNTELATYEKWLQAVHPGAAPTFDGLFAWSAAHLFTDEAQGLGGRLTRASMVKALRGVSKWTDHGLHAPQSVGAHQVGPCWRFLRLQNGQWSSLGGSSYRCGGITTVH